MKENLCSEMIILFEVSKKEVWRLNEADDGHSIHTNALYCALFFCCHRLISANSKLRLQDVVSDEDDELVVGLFSGGLFVVVGGGGPLKLPLFSTSTVPSSR